MEKKSSMRNSFKGEESQKMNQEGFRIAFEGGTSQTRDADHSNMNIEEMSEDQQKYQAPPCQKMPSPSINEILFDLVRNSLETQRQEASNSLSIDSSSSNNEFAEDIENIDKVVNSETQNPNFKVFTEKNFKKKTDFVEASVECLMKKVKLDDSTGSVNVNKSFTVFCSFLNVINGKYNLKQFLDKGLKKIWEMYLKFRSYPRTEKSIEYSIRNCKSCNKCDWRRCSCEICRVEYCMLEFCKWDSFMKEEFNSYIDYLPQIYCLMFVLRRSPDMPRSRFDLLWYVTCQKSIFTCIFSDSNFSEAFRYIKDQEKTKKKPKSDDQIDQDAIEFIDECIEVLEVLEAAKSELTRNDMKNEISEKRVNSMENEIPFSDADKCLLKEFFVNSFGPDAGTKKARDAKKSYEKIFKKLLTSDFSNNKSRYPGRINDFLKMSLIFISKELNPQPAALFKIFEHQLKTVISVGHI
jgi:hypothetical protein